MALLNSPGKKYNPKLILLGRCASRKGQAKCDHSKVPRYPPKFLWKPFAQLLTKVWKWVMPSHLSWWVTLHHHFLMILFSCPYPFAVPWEGRAEALNQECWVLPEIPPDHCRHLLGTAVIVKALKISHSTTFPGTARWKRKGQRSVLALWAGKAGMAKPVLCSLGWCAGGEAACAAMECRCLQRCPDCKAKKTKAAAKKNTIKRVQWHKLSAARGIQITRRTIKKENTDDIRLCNRGVAFPAGSQARAQVQAQVKPELTRGTWPCWKG